MTKLIYKLNINFTYYKINIKELFFRLYFVTKPPTKDYLCRIFKSKKHAGSDKKIVLPTLKNDLSYATDHIWVSPQYWNLIWLIKNSIFNGFVFFILPRISGPDLSFYTDWAR